MSTKNVIQVFEFEKLYYDEHKPFRRKHWDALCRYLEQENMKGTTAEYFRVLHQGIQFTNYVGVIQAGNLTIEILPKTDAKATIADNTTIRTLPGKDGHSVSEKGKWHKVLLDML